MQHEFLPNYTYNDYAQWKGEWEVINGIPWSMRSRYEVQHQLIAGNLLSEMVTALKLKSHCKVYAPIDYVLNEHTVLNPDGLIVCGPISKPFLDFRPNLVAEVVSDTTKNKDRNVKFELYEAESIPYYVTVDLTEKSIEIYQLKEGSYESQPMEPTKPFDFAIGDCRFEIFFSQIWE